MIIEKMCQNVIGAEKVITEYKNASNLSFVALLKD